MVTLENVVFEAQLKNLFISYGSEVLFLRYSVFYILNHAINFKIVISEWVLAHKVEEPFGLYILNPKLKGYETCRVMANIARKYFAWFDGLGS